MAVSYRNFIENDSTTSTKLTCDYAFPYAWRK